MAHLDCNTCGGIGYTEDFDHDHGIIRTGCAECAEFDAMQAELADMDRMEDWMDAMDIMAEQEAARHG